MSFTKAMKDAGYEAKASTAGDKTIYNGIYKLALVGIENKPDQKWDDGQPNPQVIAKFKILPDGGRLAGTDVYKSDYPEVTGYYSTSDELAANRKKGIAKLVDGLLSVGITVSKESDELMIEGLTQLVGSAEVYMKLSPDWRNIKDEEGNWKKKKKDDDGIDIPAFQAHSFLTFKNAEKMAKSMQKAAGHPL